MRFLLYNIRYATWGNYLCPWSGYFKKTSGNLDRITDFIRSIDPDVIGLVEVDAGSYRSRRSNQAESIAETLGHYHTYASKYGETSVFARLPLMNKQGNAFLTKDCIANEQFHYFSAGTKRLVIEMELEQVAFLLVHLSVRAGVRRKQLRDLVELVRGVNKPLVLAGDFNLFKGNREISSLLAETGLVNATPNRIPSFPSWAPKRQLDFVLHSREIDVKSISMPRVTFSDHLPIVCDFEIKE